MSLGRISLYFFGVSFGFASGLAPLGFLWSLLRASLLEDVFGFDSGLHFLRICCFCSGFRSFRFSFASLGCLWVGLRPSREGSFGMSWVSLRASLLQGGWFALGLCSLGCLSVSLRASVL